MDNTLTSQAGERAHAPDQSAQREIISPESVSHALLEAAQLKPGLPPTPGLSRPGDLGKNLPAVLITGFEPFDGDKINPSWEAASRLDGQIIDGHRVVARELPVEYGRADSMLLADIKEIQPSMIVLVGLSGGSSGLKIENRAANFDLSGPDNAGVEKDGTPIVVGGPKSYKSTLPVLETVKALQAAGIKANESNSAGNFLCNHEFYLLEDYIAKSAPGSRGGFVHVPYLPLPGQVKNQPGRPSMPLSAEIAGLKIVIDTGLKTQARDASTQA